MSRVGRFAARVDLGLGVAFLVFASTGFLFRLSGFIPTGVVFGAFGALLVALFLIARRQGYPPLKVTAVSFATLSVPQEESGGGPMLSITFKGGLRDQVQIFAEGKELVSSGWTFGRKRAYDLTVGGKKLRVVLARGAGGPKYELRSDGVLISEGTFQPESPSRTKG
ncbi:MAG: hypothetical protein JRN08_09425 [Nitrososphaerota archaeon]|nr:hypothetical protein [Nitrososphaerota archaeon]